nr:alkaline phosphatase family protein [Streptomyces natalensis]
MAESVPPPPSAPADGSLPAFTFLEPAWKHDGNSQHPNDDVAQGEQLILDVYNALRTGPDWDKTLLVITYDEHGGCYDHVPPPAGATPPDQSAGEAGFDFTRFGVRVPTVLDSPLIAPGTVFRVPDDSVPLDHTSVLKTIQQRWSVNPLTARDAAAPGIGEVAGITGLDSGLLAAALPLELEPGPELGSDDGFPRAEQGASLVVEEDDGPAVSGRSSLDPVFAGVGDHARVAGIAEHFGHHCGRPGAGGRRPDPFGIEGLGDAVGRFPRHEVLEDTDDDVGFIRDKLSFALTLANPAVRDATLGDPMR